MIGASRGNRAAAGWLASGPTLAGDGIGPGRVSSGLPVGDAALCPHPAELALALGRDWHGAGSDSKAGLQGGLCRSLGKGPIKRCLALTGKGLRGIGERGRSTSGIKHECAARPPTRYPKIGTAIPTGPHLGGMSVSSGGERIPSVCGRGRAFTLRPTRIGEGLGGRARNQPVGAHRSLLQKCQQRWRGSPLDVETAPTWAVAPSEGRNSAISGAFDCRYRGSCEPTDFFNRLIEGPRARRRAWAVNSARRGQRGPGIANREMASKSYPSLP